MVGAQGGSGMAPAPLTATAPIRTGEAGLQAEQPSPDEIFRRIFGKQRPPVAAGRYPVLLDGTPVGSFTIDPAGDGRIDATFVRDVLQPILLEEHKPPFARLAAAGDRIGFGQLRDLGLTVLFDPGELTLAVSLPMALRSARVLRLRGARMRPDLAFTEPAGLSAYASFRGGVDVVAQSTQAERGFSGFATDVDLGLNVGGVALQGRLRYAERGERKWSRGDVRAVYDDVDRLIRYEAGDLSIGRRTYQRGGRIMGLSVRREYRIDPYLNIRPAGAREFQIDRPARIDVMINGRGGRTFALPPGRYSLQDFALVPSAVNDVEIRITYASGEVETISFPAFYDIDLLAPGLFEFSANAGIPYRDRGGLRRYDDDDFNVLGYARYGLSSVLTVGGSFESNESFTNLGAEVTWASPFGSFFVAASTDVRDAAPSTGSAVFLYSWRDADQTRGRAIDAQVRLTGQDYRTLDGIFGGNITAVSSQVRLGQMINDRARVQLSGGHDRLREIGDFSEGGERWFVGVGGSYQASFGTISANLDYVRARRGGGPSASVSLFVPLGRGTVSGTYSTRDHATRLEYNRIAALGVGSVGLNAGLDRRDGADQQFVRGNYIGNRFEGFADVVRTAATGIRDTRASFGLGTALVMADGAFAVSRPVLNSFAIIEPPNQGSYAVEPRTGFGSADTRYAAYSDWLGAAVVPDLQPYLERSIQVNQRDARAAPGAGAIFNLKPGFRTGYLLRPAAVQGQGDASLVGVLADANGVPLAFVSGEARRVGGTEREPKLVFTNGSGRFFLDVLEVGGRYELSVTVNGRVVTTIIEVPKANTGPVRLPAPIRLNTIRENKDAG
jgi:outer membrane usher protein